MKSTILAVEVACICVVLAGCATPYQSTRFSGGFSETQLSSNVFKVYFRGNGYTSDERAADFTLMRSAELAYTHGFAYFIIVDEQSGASYSTVTTPTTTYTTTNVTATGGDTAYGTSTSTTVGGESYVIRKPSKENTIVCFREKPSVQGVVYESQFVMQSIRAKYGMKPEPVAAPNLTSKPSDEVPPAKPAAGDSAMSLDDWIQISSGKNPAMSVYMRKESLQRRQGWLSASILFSYSAPQYQESGDAISSIIYLNIYDCANRRSAWVSTDSYASPIGNGAHVGASARSIEQAARDLVSVNPGSVLAQELDTVCAAATNPAPAITNAVSASNWVPYTSNVAGELIDFDSIKVSGNVRRAWFKSTSVSATMKGLPPQLAAGVDYVLALDEFNCNDREFRIVGLSFHNVDSAPSSDPSAKWAPVAPGSVADAAMNYLCKLKP